MMFFNRCGTGRFTRGRPHLWETEFMRLVQFKGRAHWPENQHRIKKRIRMAVPVLFILGLILPPAGSAKIDLSTLSGRDNVQTTIYKSEDLTLVRDSRTLQFAKGDNQIQFSWANTRIDPTSLTLEIKSSRNLVTVKEMIYPPGAKDLAIWQIRAKKACQAKIDILYFTSGLSWQSYYMAFVSSDGHAMDLKGYVRVSNRSGEDYARARTRLVVGKISLLEEIAVLAGQRYPFGRPDLMNKKEQAVRAAYADGIKLLKEAGAVETAAVSLPKKIIKQGLSEYFLFTIEGKETIEDGWARRLVSFEARDIPVTHTYAFEAERYGARPIHRLVFHNKEEEGLGCTPLPGGEIKVYQSLGTPGALVFKGADTTVYIPVGKKVELNLGPTRDVAVAPKLMKVEKANLVFDAKGNLTGFDEIRDMEISLANYSGKAAVMEIIRNIGSPRCALSMVETGGRVEQTDQKTFIFYNTLAPGQAAAIRYRVTIKRGDAK